MRFFKLTALVLMLLALFLGASSTTGCIRRPLIDIDIFGGNDDYEDEDEDEDNDEDDDDEEEEDDDNEEDD